MENKVPLSDRTANCTFVKTILMLLIILFHSLAFWRGDWFTVETVSISSKLLAVLADFLPYHGNFGFALVSGYLLFYLKEEKGKYQGGYLPFICNKIKRLIIPYCFASFIWVGPITSCLYHYSVSQIIKNFVLACSPGQLWFLWMLFWVFVIFYPLFDLMKDHDVLGAIIAFGFFCIGTIGAHFLPNVFRIWDGCRYLIIFWIGFEMRKHEGGIIDKIHPLIWTAADLILFAGSIMLPLSGGISIGYELVMHAVGAIALFEVLQWIAANVRWKDSRALTFFSKHSMTVYLFHQQVIYFTLLMLNGVVNPYLNVAINFVVSLAVSLVISVILMHWKTTRFLIGEK